MPHALIYDRHVNCKTPPGRTSEGAKLNTTTPLIVPLKKIEYGFGYTIIRSPYTPYSIYLRGTI